MSAALGLLLGAGVAMVWWSFWPMREDETGGRWAARTQDKLVLAGAPGVRPVGLIAIAAACAVLAAVVVGGVAHSLPIGVAVGLLAARGPFALVSSRAERRLATMRRAWPDAVDHLASGLRAGLSLPEAVAQLGERGPEELRPAFTAFASDFRASGRFGDCLDDLKARLADPVADRIVEALRLTREVGGTDVGRLLRTLGQFLREEAKVRGELEARQSWTVNAARLAATAPWAVLLVLSTRPAQVQAYNSPAGVAVLAAGAASTAIAYRLMMRVGRLPQEDRVLR